MARIPGVLFSIFLSMKTWPKAVIRFLAVANILLGGSGLYLQADSARRFIQRNQLGFSIPKVYWITASISFVWLLRHFYLASFFGGGTAGPCCSAIGYSDSSWFI